MQEHAGLCDVYNRLGSAFMRGEFAGVTRLSCSLSSVAGSRWCKLGVNTY